MLRVQLSHLKPMSVEKSRFLERPKISTFRIWENDEVTLPFF